MSGIARLTLAAIGGVAATLAVQMLLTGVFSLSTYPLYVLSAIAGSVLQFGLPAVVCWGVVKSVGGKDEWLLVSKDRLAQATVINQILCVVIIAVMCQPLVEWSYCVGSQLCDWLGVKGLTASMQESSNIVLMTIMQFDNVWQWAVSVLTIAVVPAVCEELFFRRTLLPLLYEKTKSWHSAIVVTAVIFSLLHLDIVGFIPRLILGALLGLIYYLCRGNMVMPILMHTLNNLMVVIVVGVGGDEAREAMTGEPQWPGTLMPLLSLGVVLLELKTLQIVKKKIEGEKEGNNI